MVGIVRPGDSRQLDDSREEQDNSCDLAEVKCGNRGYP